MRMPIIKLLLILGYNIDGTNYGKEDVMKSRILMCFNSS